MRKRLCAVLLTAAWAAAQNDPVTRVTVNLIQFDAVVQDKQGRYVRDLKPEDFEVYQDGKRQKITHAEYVSAEELRGPDLQRASNRGELRARDVRRTMIVIVDDDRISYENMEYCRQALRAYLDNDFQPGDLVAILTTRYGSGFYHQFTADREQLRARTERLHWQGYPLEHMKYQIPPVIPILKQAMMGLKQLPGRKSIVLFADGVQADFRDYSHIADAATRSAITFHTVDSRGLATLMPTAADQVVIGEDQRATVVHDPIQLARREPLDYRASQNLLYYLASETGGLFLRENNDLRRQMHRIVMEQSGYYLIAWNPGDAAFRVVPGRFAEYHKVEIKTRLKGLTVRSRHGFYGVENTPQQKSPRNAMQEALFSPFKTEDLNVRLTAVHTRHGEQDVIEAMVHIDGKSLYFQPQDKGCVKASFEILALPLQLSDETGTFNSHLTEARFCGAPVQQVQKEGLVCTLRTPVKRPGAYQMRVAVRNTTPGAKPSLPNVLPGLQRRDDAATQTGSAYQFVVVPEFMPRDIRISTILLRRDTSVLRDVKPELVESASTVEAFFRAAIPGDPAVRRFRRDDSIRFGADLHHGKDADIQVKVLRDGQEILNGQPNINDGVYIYGVLKPLAAGFYVLQLDAKRQDGRTASQSIDFEVE